jgi:hypothetical protein
MKGDAAYYTRKIMARHERYQRLAPDTRARLHARHMAKLEARMRNNIAALGWDVEVVARG